MTSPVTPEKLQRLKESLKKVSEKRSGFKKSSLLKKRITKDFKNHPLYFTTAPSTSSASTSSAPSSAPSSASSPAPSPALSSAPSSATSSALSTSRQEDVDFVNVFIKPVSTIEQQETKFKNLKKMEEYNVVEELGNGWYILLINDTHHKVQLPRCVPPPPTTSWFEQLFMVRTDGKIKWIVKKRSTK